MAPRSWCHHGGRVCLMVVVSVCVLLLPVVLSQQQPQESGNDLPQRPTFHGRQRIRVRRPTTTEATRAVTEDVEEISGQRLDSSNFGTKMSDELDHLDSLTMEDMFAIEAKQKEEELKRMAEELIIREEEEVKRENGRKGPFQGGRRRIRPSTPPTDMEVLPSSSVSLEVIPEIVELFNNTNIENRTLTVEELIVEETLRREEELVRRNEEEARREEELLRRDDEEKRRAEELVRRADQQKLVDEELARRPDHQKLLDEELARRADQQKLVDEELLRREDQQKLVDEELLRREDQQKLVDEELARREAAAENLALLNMDPAVVAEEADVNAHTDLGSEDAAFRELEERRAASLRGGHGGRGGGGRRPVEEEEEEEEELPGDALSSGTSPNVPPRSIRNRLNTDFSGVRTHRGATQGSATQDTVQAERRQDVEGLTVEETKPEEENEESRITPMTTKETLDDKPITEKTSKGDQSSKKALTYKDINREKADQYDTITNNNNNSNNNDNNNSSRQVSGNSSVTAVIYNVTSRIEDSGASANTPGASLSLALAVLVLITRTFTTHFESCQQL